jgi:hypothetical protein
VFDPPFEQRFKILITFYRAWLALDPSTSGLPSRCLLSAGWPAANPEADGSRRASAEVVVVLPSVYAVEMPTEYCEPSPLSHDPIACVC